MSDTEDRRLEAARPLATFVLAMLTVVTVVALCRLFPDWSYLRPMVALALGMHAIAFVLRVARVPLWAALPALLVAMLVLIGIIYYRDTLNGLLPSGRTFELMRVDLRIVLDQFPSAVAPVPSEGSFATSAAAIVALCVLLSDTFAFRAMGRIEAVVPSAVLFVFTSALGADRYRVLVATLWIAAALLTVATLRFTDADHEGGWMGSRRASWVTVLPTIMLTVGVSAVAAYAVAPQLPGAGERALVDTRNRQGSVTEVLSPLVDIRARMKNRGNSELFTVDSSEGGHYWRLTGLPTFDGSTWSPTAEDLRELGDRTAEIRGGTTITQRFTIERMGGKYVPAAHSPAQVSPGDVVLWAGQTESLIVQNGVSEGDVIDVVSILRTPTIDELNAATVTGAAQLYYQLPGGIPASARDTARDVTASATTPYARAMALQSFFRDNFTYNLDVQLGNSNDAIDAFLRDREGFCQQFAGTFAVMARSIGLPARVAVGYTQGDLGSDGLFHVFGRNAHAWPEIWFDDIGWVAFEPTPQRGNPDASQYTLVQPQQATPGDSANGNNPQNTTPTTQRDPDGGTPTTVRGGVGPDGRPGASSTTAVAAVANGGGSSGASSAVAVVLLGAVVLLVLWVLLLPRIFSAVTRPRHRSPRDRVIGAWHRACHELSLAGAPPVGGATPLEYVHAAKAATGVSDATLRELAAEVTNAVYSRGEPDDRAAARCETLESEVSIRCRSITPWAVRLRGMVDPRMMRQRLVG